MNKPTKEQLEAMEQVVEYLYEDEKENYNLLLGDGEDVSGHVFLAVEEIQKYLESRYVPRETKGETNNAKLVRSRPTDNRPER